ncbi:OmpA family protein [Flavilitoribacter nigricans]|uniref:OmpA family protein n=1 Tax=Flavilitoribacter nigricans (strain ATCC 23147 / DSM 23189 / NBRC 102662 / NCIMB 1420 / SS-2) TaxID=1122177 RepID=A0A2D0NI09_FLAN2|nr:OmpA family protein [Flavilitoribacter nigricans]PHN07403.1 hypothetical protein CRP01_07170 [Flavilitoribacter nigricans DSM 23189 = NBRC 102662]
MRSICASLCTLLFCFTLIQAVAEIPLSGTAAFQDSLPIPVFSAFEGVVYKIPIKRVKLGYGNDILKLPVVDTIHWDRIDFPDSDIKETPFPGVNLTQGFGIIFTGTVKIPKTGWYQFATKSDDGTILWIDGQKIVDNDKDHRMRLRVDSVALRAGTYPVRLWYYQAYPTRYGVQLDGRYYHDLGSEDEGLVRDTVTLSQEQLLFAHNSNQLLPPAVHLLDSLADKLRLNAVRRISITGHTDNTGTPAYNARLSRERAQAVQAALQKHFTDRQVAFAVEGRGETQPIAGNDTETGRARNRRVVIEIEYY